MKSAEDACVAALSVPCRFGLRRRLSRFFLLLAARRCRRVNICGVSASAAMVAAVSLQGTPPAPGGLVAPGTRCLRVS